MKKFDVYEDTELNSIDLETKRLSKIKYGIKILELLNVTKLANGRYKIKFINKTGNFNQNETQQNMVKRFIIPNGEKLEILGKKYDINDIIRDEELNMTIKLDLTRRSTFVIVNKIILIVSKGFMDECSRCNRPSTMLASDNRRYCSVDCFLKKCSVCKEKPGVREFRNKYYCKECFSKFAEQIDLSELKVF